MSVLPEPTYIIYLITNLVNGKVYVGQTEQALERRWSLHKSRARRNEGYTAHLYNAMRKYGFESFKIKEIASCKTLDWSNYLERLYILLFDSMNPKIGYNMNSGGDKRIPRPEEIEKQRQKILGTKHPPEFGQHQSEMLRKAWSEGRHTGNRGQKLPASHREKTSQRMKGRGSCNFRHDICSEELLFLLNNGVSSHKIGIYFGINNTTVMKRIRLLNLPYKIPERPKGKENKNYKSVDETLLRELFSRRISLREIGKRLGLDHHTVSNKIKALGLTRE